MTLSLGNSAYQVVPPEYFIDSPTAAPGGLTDSGVLRRNPDTGETYWDDAPPGKLLASCREQTNLAQALGINAFVVLNPRLSVPPTTCPVRIEYGGPLLCTTNGTGSVGLGVGDYSTGSLVEAGLSYVYGTYVSTGTFGPALGVIHASLLLDPSTEWRSFRMIGGVFRDSGSLAASLNVSSPFGGHSRAAYMRAVTT